MTTVSTACESGWKVTLFLGAALLLWAACADVEPPNGDGDGDTDSDVGGDGDADADTDADTDTDSDSDTDSDADTDADTDADGDPDEGPRCGDGTCDPGESEVSCPSDCGPSCGDDECSVGESYCNCPEDCADRCGDGCCSDTESSCLCETDCGPHCGDGTCNCGETETTCAGDCGGSDCGGSVCGAGETCCFSMYCADLSTDPMNCGSCGNDCALSFFPLGDGCTDGLCTCGGGPGCAGTLNDACCDSRGCSDTDWDEDHCGTCGWGCFSFETCEFGWCE